MTIAEVVWEPSNSIKADVKGVENNTREAPVLLVQEEWNLLHSTIRNTQTRITLYTENFIY